MYRVNLISGGWLVGKVDINGEYTGDTIAYMYPDYKTALVGEFRKGEMIKAKPAMLSQIVIKEGVLCPDFDVVSERYVLDSSTSIP